METKSRSVVERSPALIFVCIAVIAFGLIMGWRDVATSVWIRALLASLGGGLLGFAVLLAGRS